MSQLELLWDYQQADVEAERQENAMKRSPTRQRLLKYQEYLREQRLPTPVWRRKCMPWATAWTP